MSYILYITGSTILYNAMIKINLKYPFNLLININNNIDEMIKSIIYDETGMKHMKDITDSDIKRIIQAIMGIFMIIFASALYDYPIIYISSTIIILGILNIITIKRINNVLKSFNPLYNNTIDELMNYINSSDNIAERTNSIMIMASYTLDINSALNTINRYILILKLIAILLFITGISLFIIIL